MQNTNESEPVIQQLEITLNAAYHGRNLCTSRERLNWLAVCREVEKLEKLIRTKMQDDN